MKKFLIIMMATIFTCGIFVSTSMATPKPQYGGVLKILSGLSIANIGYPAARTGPEDGIIARPALESLFGLDESGSEETVPQLATDWKVAPDYSYVTISLRKGVKFHDGTDFNAEAAKFNLELTRKAQRPELKEVTSIDILDNHTIKLNLSSYNPTFIMSLVGYPNWMVSPTALKKMGEDKAKYHPVGTGPFKIVSCQRDSLIKYEKFDGYWQEGKPYLDGIEFLFIADDVTRLVCFKKGDAHSIVVSAIDAISLKGLSNLNSFTSYSYIIGLCADNGNPDSIFSDIKIRRAIAHAIDTTTIAQSLGRGYYLTTNQWRFAGWKGYNHDVVGYPYNPQKAKQLLAEAGYPDGFKTTLTYEALPLNSDIFTAVQGYLAKVGIDAKLDRAEPGRFRVLAAEGWNNQLIQFTAPCSKGFDPLRFFTSRLSKNSNRFDPNCLKTSEEYNKTLKAVLVEHDPDKSLAMVHKLQKITVDDLCIAIPIVATGNVRVDYSNVHDLTTYTYAGIMDWQPAKVWLSK